MVGSDLNRAGGVTSFLEILGLWCLAIVQPLLDLIAQNAPFLLHYRADGVDLMVWLGILALLPPALLWLLVEGGAARLGEEFRSGTRAVILGTLLVALGLGLLRRLGDPVPAWLLLPLAVGAAWLAAMLVRRSPGIGRFFALLGLALPVVLMLFWGSGAATAARTTSSNDVDMAFLARGEASSADASSAEPTIVLVVFDEMPLVSILDAGGGIDVDLCPSLAALSGSATWFRNATTVWSSTNPSIVSMLTGREAERGTPPTRHNYPDNLLTWLQETHEVRAFELLTAMAPPNVLELEPRPSRTARLRGLSADTLIIVAHQLVPPALGDWIPPIDNRWGDFWSVRTVRGRVDPQAEPIPPTPWAFALGDARGRRFERFLQSIEAGERARTYFAHIMLPHMPYRYLPSGRVYGGRPVYGRASTAWMKNEWFALETYQRHLLQVGYVDRLIGDLVDRLRATGLWDEALVIITSDHGASHWPGQDRRLPREMEHPDDVLRVPLFVKVPGQMVGAIDDRAALTTDILPTVGDVLGRQVPWPMPGVSLLGEPRGRVERTLLDPAGGELRFPTGFEPDEQSLSRKLALFDPAAGELRWVRLGPYRELIGRHLSDLLAGGVGLDCSGVLDQDPVVEDWNPGDRYSPALLTGEVACKQQLPVDPFVLAAVNGRIAGSGAMQQVSGASGLFAVMTAEALWSGGANDVRLFVASGAPGEPWLTLVTLTGADVGRDGGRGGMGSAP